MKARSPDIGKNCFQVLFFKMKNTHHFITRRIKVYTMNINVNRGMVQTSRWNIYWKTRFAYALRRKMRDTRYKSSITYEVIRKCVRGWRNCPEGSFYDCREKKKVE